MTVTEQHTEPIQDATSSDVAATTTTGAPEDHVVEELLVEEISIDGMCGVY